VPAYREGFDRRDPCANPCSHSCGNSCGSQQQRP
jgi:hypothetical protein